MTKVSIDPHGDSVLMAKLRATAKEHAWLAGLFIAPSMLVGLFLVPAIGTLLCFIPSVLAYFALTGMASADTDFQIGSVWSTFTSSWSFSLALGISFLGSAGALIRGGDFATLRRASEISLAVTLAFHPLVRGVLRAALP